MPKRPPTLAGKKAKPRYVNGFLREASGQRMRHCRELQPQTQVGGFQLRQSLEIGPKQNILVVSFVLGNVSPFNVFLIVAGAGKSVMLYGHTLRVSDFLGHVQSNVLKSNSPRTRRRWSISISITNRETLRALFKLLEQLLNNLYPVLKFPRSSGQSTNGPFEKTYT